MSVLGETDADLLAAVTDLDEATLRTAIHDGVASTLLVTSTSPLGVTWRHRLMRERFRVCYFPSNSKPWHAAPPTIWSRG